LQTAELPKMLVSWQCLHSLSDIFHQLHDVMAVVSQSWKTSHSLFHLVRHML